MEHVSSHQLNTKLARQRERERDREREIDTEDCAYKVDTAGNKYTERTHNTVHAVCTVDCYLQTQDSVNDGYTKLR